MYNLYNIMYLSYKLDRMDHHLYILDASIGALISHHYLHQRKMSDSTCAILTSNAFN